MNAGHEHAQPPTDHPHAGHAHAGGAGHQHGVSADADRRYLAAALGLLVAFMVVEVVVALVSGSLALLSDAGHMLSDVGAIAGSLWALRLASRPARGRWTFGWKRAEVLSAAGNGITLLVVAAVVGAEAIHRLIVPAHVEGLPVVVVAVVGVAVNVAAAAVLARADRTSINVQGAFAHVVTDLYGFLGTVVAGVIVLTTGYLRADSIASLLVVALMVRAAWGLLRDSGHVLLEAAPKDVDLDDVLEHMRSREHVVDVHDLHVWTVTSSLPALSAHVVVRDECFTRGCAPQLLDELQDCLTGHFDVEHSTFQLEPAGHRDHERDPH